MIHIVSETVIQKLKIMCVLKRKMLGSTSIYNPRADRNICVYVRFVYMELLNMITYSLFTGNFMTLLMIFYDF